MIRRCFSLFLVLVVLGGASYGQNSGIYKDDFIKSTGDWYVGKTDESDSKIENGKYYLSHTAEEGSYLFSKEIPFDHTKDFYIEIKIAQLDGLETYPFGLLYGMANSQNFYGFTISSSGSYSVYGFKDNTYMSVKDWTSDVGNIQPLGSYNVLGLKKTGSKLYYSINGQQKCVLPFEGVFGNKIGFVLNYKMSAVAEYIRFEYMNPKFQETNADVKYKKENLGAGVNTKYEEIVPIISSDGKTLYFDRSNDPGNFGETENDDIWYSTLVNGVFSKARNIGKPLNNETHNFVFSVSPDGNTLLVANVYGADGSPNGSGVSITHKTKTGWEVPVKLEIEDYYNDAKYVGYNLSANRKALIMSVKRNDTKGDHDFYVSFLMENGKWSKPLNMGPVINTDGNEVTPFLAADNVTLYYSTNGRGGFGDNDIFMTRRLDDSWTKWSEPINMGPAVNTDDWDAYYTVEATGNYAYFTSYKDGYGSGDLFRIRLLEEVKPNPVVVISGKVLDKETKAPISAEIVYYDLETHEEVGIARSNPVDGTYKIILPYGKKYGFNAERKGYYAESDNIDLSLVKEYQEIREDLLLAAIQVGKKIQLNNVFFVQSKPELLPSSYGELDRLIQILKENPTIKIDVAGHTDNVGDAQKNLELSEKRVEAIKTYLIKNGINSNRITGKGYGGTKPIASNDNEETRKLNRRVEFTIVEK